MKILMPVNSKEGILRATQFGDKTEFYAGFEDDAWYRHFGKNEDMNRMSAFRSHANLPADSLYDLAKTAADAGQSLYITLNAGIYSLEQEKWLEGVLKEISVSGASGVILGDPCMVQYAAAYGLKTVASTMVGVYNSDIARWAADIGFNRIILPRDITLTEASSIIKEVPGPEYECFIMRNGCRYADSSCLCRHSDRYGALCSYLDRAEVCQDCSGDAFEEREECYYNHYVYSKAFHKDACGLCAIWRLMQMGVIAGKIVGRADRTDAVFDDAVLLLRNEEIAASCSSEEEYLKKMIFPERSKDICIEGLCCYYPEVRFGKGVHK